MSWRTTLLGVFTIAGAICIAGKALLDGDPATTPNWESSVQMIGVGIALLAARDHKVTSEDAGLK